VIYDIRHVTTYEYEKPGQLRPLHATAGAEERQWPGVDLAQRRYPPAPDGAQRPAAISIGTLTESVVIEAAHRTLRIDSRSRVSVSRQPPARDASSPSWESIRDIAFEATSLGPASPVGYVFASPLVPVLRPVSAYATTSFAPGAGILAGAG